MELPIYTKLIEDNISENNAMSLLFDIYQVISSEEEKDTFVLALIGQAVTTHQLLKHECKNNPLKTT
ncbi:hypothetical protein A4G18_00610 [Pasteurellaceae bacterium Pebbles2]|nr:hypothetical protein [Pasteurellaceae bacterium Pebbles2]